MSERFALITGHIPGVPGESAVEIDRESLEGILWDEGFSTDQIAGVEPFLMDGNHFIFRGATFSAGTDLVRAAQNREAA